MRPGQLKSRVGIRQRCARGFTMRGEISSPNGPPWCTRGRSEIRSQTGSKRWDSTISAGRLRFGPGWWQVTRHNLARSHLRNRIGSSGRPTESIPCLATKTSQGRTSPFWAERGKLIRLLAGRHAKLNANFIAKCREDCRQKLIEADPRAVVFQGAPGPSKDVRTGEHLHFEP